MWHYDNTNSFEFQVIGGIFWNLFINTPYNGKLSTWRLAHLEHRHWTYWTFLHKPAFRRKDPLRMWKKIWTSEDICTKGRPMRWQKAFFLRWWEISTSCTARSSQGAQEPIFSSWKARKFLTVQNRIHKERRAGRDAWLRTRQKRESPEILAISGDSASKRGLSPSKKSLKTFTIATALSCFLLYKNADCCKNLQ